MRLVFTGADPNVGTVFFAAVFNFDAPIPVIAFDHPAVHLPMVYFTVTMMPIRKHVYIVMLLFLFFGFDG